MPLSFFMREHFKVLMFDCHKQYAAPVSKAGVHTSVNAARKSAYATEHLLFNCGQTYSLQNSSASERRT